MEKVKRKIRKRAKDGKTREQREIERQKEKTNKSKESQRRNK